MKKRQPVKKAQPMKKRQIQGKSNNKINQKSTTTSEAPRTNATTETHVHEFTGFTEHAEKGGHKHSHRFSGVTSEVLQKGDSHVHVLFADIDSSNHRHSVAIITGPAIPISDGKHIHVIKGATTQEDGHVHSFEFSTQVQKPRT